MLHRTGVLVLAFAAAIAAPQPITPDERTAGIEASRKSGPPFATSTGTSELRGAWQAVHDELVQDEAASPPTPYAKSSTKWWDA